MGVMLSDQVIKEHLEGLCEHLRQANTEQAEMTLDVIQFERLLRPIVDPMRRFRPIDPAAPFGVERVRATGEHLRRCRSELGRADVEGALASAEAALLRWTQLETERKEP